eukprot:767838-Hanusia_phi.AAC.4
MAEGKKRGLVADQGWIPFQDEPAQPCKDTNIPNMNVRWSAHRCTTYAASWDSPLPVRGAYQEEKVQGFFRGKSEPAEEDYLSHHSLTKRVSPIVVCLRFSSPIRLTQLATTLHAVSDIAPSLHPQAHHHVTCSGSPPAASGLQSSSLEDFDADMVKPSRQRPTSMRKDGICSFQAHMETKQQ